MTTRQMRRTMRHNTLGSEKKHTRFRKETNLLSERVLLGSDRRVVVIEGLLELSSRDTDLLRKCLTTVEALHETTADIMLAMPFDLLRRLTVEYKTNGELSKAPKQKQNILVARFIISNHQECVPCRSPRFCQ